MGQTKDGRGNICPVTIILPTLAMEAIDLVWDKIPEELKILLLYQNMIGVKMKL